MKRLTEKHPTSIKVEKLFTAMEDLGLTITVNRYGQFIVCDNEFPGKDFYLRDTESEGGDMRGSVTMLPSYVEYKIVYEG